MQHKNKNYYISTTILKSNFNLDQVNLNNEGRVTVPRQIFFNILQKDCDHF